MLRPIFAWERLAMRVRKRSTAEYVELDRLRMQVAVAIRAAVDVQGLTTVEAARKTGIHRSELSRLLNGHIEKYGLERLVYVALALGIRCSIRVRLPGK